MTIEPNKLIAVGMLLAVLSASPSCKSKAEAENAPGDSTTTTGKIEEAIPKQLDSAKNYLDELMKLPDAKSNIDNFVFGHIRDFPDEAFELEAPKITVTHPNNDLYEVTAVFTGTIKTNIYINPVPAVVYDEEKMKSFALIVTELLEAKGSKKTLITKAQVRYGPVKGGRNHDKVMWDWVNPKTTGDNMEVYIVGGPPRWASAERYKINSDGTASADPYIVIRGTPDYQAALAKFPSLAKDEAAAAARRKRQEEERRFSEKMRKEEEEANKKEQERTKKLTDEALKQ